MISQHITLQRRILSHHDWQNLRLGYWNKYLSSFIYIRFLSWFSYQEHHPCWQTYWCKKKVCSTLVQSDDLSHSEDAECWTWGSRFWSWRMIFQHSQVWWSSDHDTLHWSCTEHSKIRNISYQAWLPGSHQCFVQLLHDQETEDLDKHKMIDLMSRRNCWPASRPTSWDYRFPCSKYQDSSLDNIRNQHNSWW